MKKYLIPAIFFSVWTLVFGTWFIIEGKSLIGPLMTGVSAITFWIYFWLDLKIKKKRNERTY